MVRIWDIYIYHWDTEIQTVQKREMERNKDIIGIYNDIYIYRHHIYDIPTLAKQRDVVVWRG